MNIKDMFTKMVRPDTSQQAIRPGDRRLNDLDFYFSQALRLNTTVEDVLTGKATTANAPTQQQRELIESVRDHRRTVLRSGHAQGKTEAIGMIGAWFLAKNVNNIVLMTSAKEDQGVGVMMPKLAQYWNRAFMLEVEPRQQLYPNRRKYPLWFARIIVGQRTESFASYHATGEGEVLLIVDEGSAMTQALEEAGEGLISTHGGRWLTCGNPLNSQYSDPFRRMFSDERYNKIHWDTTRHPNWVHNAPIYHGCFSREWIEREMVDKFGRNDPVVMARCFGEFAKVQLNYEQQRRMFDPDMVARIAGYTPEQLESAIAGDNKAEEDNGERLFGDDFVQGQVSSEGMGPDGQPFRKVLGTAMLKDDLEPSAYGSSTQGE